MLIAVLIFQIAVNVKVSLGKASEAFFKYTDVLCGKIDSPNAKATINLSGQNFI